MILIVDNNDSFTYNLGQLFRSLSSGAPVHVARADALEEQLALRPSHVILSPGPGHPREARLACELPGRLRQVPVLGVCLGHQALALGEGALVNRAAQPTHGRCTSIRHDGSPLFRGLTNPFRAALYHSLLVDPSSLPSSLQACGWSGQGDIMALRHASRPHFGVQFHPESFLTPGGAVLARNFLQMGN